MPAPAHARIRARAPACSRAGASMRGAGEGGQGPEPKLVHPGKFSWPRRVDSVGEKFLPQDLRFSCYTSAIIGWYLSDPYTNIMPTPVTDDQIMQAAENDFGLMEDLSPAEWKWQQEARQRRVVAARKRAEKAIEERELVRLEIKASLLVKEIYEISNKQFEGDRGLMQQAKVHLEAKRILLDRVLPVLKSVDLDTFLQQQRATESVSVVQVVRFDNGETLTYLNPKGDSNAESIEVTPEPEPEPESKPGPEPRPEPEHSLSDMMGWNEPEPPPPPLPTPRTIPEMPSWLS